MFLPTFKRCAALFLAVILLLALCSACTEQQSTDKPQTTQTDNTTSSDAEPVATTTLEATKTTKSVTTTTKSAITTVATTTQTTKRSSVAITTTLKSESAATTKTTVTTEAITTTESATPTTSTTKKTGCTHFVNYNYDGRWQRDSVAALPVDVYWKNDDLVVTCYIVNGYANRVAYIARMEEISVVNVNGVIAKGTFSTNQNLILYPMSYTEYTFHFIGDEVANVGADLSNIMVTMDKSTIKFINP